MSAIKTWSATAAGNNAAPPDGFPENMAPSAVNDAMREVMAQVKAWYDDAEWRDLGHAVTYASADSFTVAADVTAIYTAGRRIRCADAATLHGTVVASSYGAPDTTVTVALDSGSLSASLSGVAIDMLSAASQPRGWFELGRRSASGDPEIDFVLPAGFAAFRFLLIGLVPAADGVALLLRTSSDGGSSFDAGSSYHFVFATRSASDGSVGGDNSQASAAIHLSSAVGNDTGEGLNGEATLFDPMGTSLVKQVVYSFALVNANGVLVTGQGSGVRANAAAVDAVRFLFAGGDIASGTIAMFGLRA